MSSYWAWPAVLFFVAILLAYVTIELDYRFGAITHSLLRDILFFNDLSIATVRTYLSTLVGAIITVAGVVFSLTILTVSSASNQFGPRILNNFMRDKVNQITIAVYTSTFVYASTILLSLYESGEIAFIPYLSVLVSYVLALLCVAFLIYYIHHIPASLRIETIVYGIAENALEMIKDRFPRGEGVETIDIDYESEEMEAVRDLNQGLCYNCGPGPIGYVQAIDLEGLLECSKKYDVVVGVKARPGAFLNGHAALLSCDRDLDEEACKLLNKAFAVGVDRTLPQNLMYLLSQLMEIAIRSMSPGINDPITAMSCIDWLEACLFKTMNDPAGCSLVLDDEKHPRILIEPVDTSEILFQVRKGMAEHMSKNFATSLHLMESLERLYKRATRESQRKALRACAAEVLAFSKKGVPVQGQLDRLAEIFSSFSPNHLNYSNEYQ